MVCVFQRIMDADLIYHQFMQGNDTKHASQHAKGFLSNIISLVETSPESLDGNPINLLYQVKFYACVQRGVPSIIACGL